MKTRREFLRAAAVGAAAAHPLTAALAKAGEPAAAGREGERPVVVSTWDFGPRPTAEAWTILAAKGRALDAVEAGVRVVEADPAVQSVGYGGLPDRDGRVTLDACIMDERGNIGSVAALEHIMHPVSVARAVMEKSPHVMLVGDGALQFALEQGFPRENLLTGKSEADWKAWLRTANYTPPVGRDNHDTIGMLALDAHGNLSGACTTSGLAYKMHGRVGDSPIIGAGLYVDNAVGGATATGQGEEIIRVTGSFLVVELMRQGRTPSEACEEAVRRIADKFRARGKDPADTQVGFLALDRLGRVGGYGLHRGFQYAVKSNSTADIEDAAFLS